MYAGFDGTHRQLQFLGYLFVGVLLDKAQTEQKTVLLGQRLQKMLYLQSLLRVDDTLLGCGGVGRRCGETLVYRETALTAARKVYKGVASDGIEPLPEGVIAVVGVYIEIYFYKCLLQKVVGIIVIAEALHEQTAYGVAVAVEQMLESGCIALENHRCQSAVVGYDIFVYLHDGSFLRLDTIRAITAVGRLSKSYMR